MNARGRGAWLVEAVVVAAATIALTDAMAVPALDAAPSPSASASAVASIGVAPSPAVVMAATTSAVDIVALRESARGVLAARCMPCHRRSDPRANPKALAIYDLDDEDWARNMTPARFTSALGRLRSARPEERAAITAFAEARAVATAP